MQKTARPNKRYILMLMQIVWWVFGEVAKELDYDIFMAEAENVGYKRTKRGENPMPNDLYDIEYAPNIIDTKKVLEGYDRDIRILNEQLAELKTELEAVNKKMDGKETEALKKKAEKLNADIETQNTKIEQTETKKEITVRLKDAGEEGGFIEIGELEYK